MVVHLCPMAWLTVCLALLPPAATGQTGGTPTRGQLLYEIHCIACHDSQMHWRDQRLASDWPGLVEQVRRWQLRANLHWSDADIVEVARHLNDTIYRFGRPVGAAPSLRIGGVLPCPAVRVPRSVTGGIAPQG